MLDSSYRFNLVVRVHFNRNGFAVMSSLVVGSNPALGTKGRIDVYFLIASTIIEWGIFMCFSKGGCFAAPLAVGFGSTSLETESPFS